MYRLLCAKLSFSWIKLRFLNRVDSLPHAPCFTTTVEPLLRNLCIQETSVLQTTVFGPTVNHYIENNLCTKETSVIQTILYGPLKFTIERFHCIHVIYNRYMNVSCTTSYHSLLVKEEGLFVITIMVLIVHCVDSHSQQLQVYNGCCGLRWSLWGHNACLVV